MKWVKVLNDHENVRKCSKKANLVETNSTFGKHGQHCYLNEAKVKDILWCINSYIITEKDSVFSYWGKGNTTVLNTENNFITSNKQHIKVYLQSFLLIVEVVMLLPLPCLPARDCLAWFSD